MIAEAIPFFGTLLSLLAAIAYAPMAIVVPMHLWLYDFAEYRKGTAAKRAVWAAHVVILLAGLFLTIGGSYAMIRTIYEEYATGKISSAFSCADK